MNQSQNPNICNLKEVSFTGLEGTGGKGLETIMHMGNRLGQEKVSVWFLQKWDGQCKIPPPPPQVLNQTPDSGCSREPRPEEIGMQSFCLLSETTPRKGHPVKSPLVIILLLTSSSLFKQTRIDK